MYLLKFFVSKNIARWDYKRYALFVDSYDENNFLRILLSFPISFKNIDNEGPFWTGFYKVIYKQQEIILRLTKLFSNLALIIFRKCVINGMMNLKYKIKSGDAQKYIFIATYMRNMSYSLETHKIALKQAKWTFLNNDIKLLNREIIQIYSCIYQKKHVLWDFLKML